MCATSQGLHQRILVPRERDCERMRVIFHPESIASSAHASRAAQLQSATSLEGHDIIRAGESSGALESVLNGAVGLVAHDLNGQPTRISTEGSDGPAHGGSVVHDRIVEQGRHGREAKGLDLAENLVVRDVTALRHEDKVHLVARLQECKAVHDRGVRLDGVGGTSGDDNGKLLSHV